MVQTKRESGIELFRIITMLIIVAHHYVVNSGLSPLIGTNYFSANSIFLMLFGWGGKTGINCFVLITGYFMCTSKITLKKFLKLVLWVEFYKVIIYFIFVFTGYSSFGIKSFIKALLPVTSIADGFTSTYILFYLFIPFLNVLVHALHKKQHLLLIGLCLFVYSVLGLVFTLKYNYVTWFSIIYLIGSYLRLHEETWFNSKKFWGTASVFALLASFGSVLVCAFIHEKIGLDIHYYYFVADSHRPLAVLMAVCSFMYFKNIKIGYKPWINTVAASAFGVLLIHANSNTMRQWLWQDVLQNVTFFDSKWLVIHAVGSVIAIYILCTVIDMIRIRFIENPVFKLYDKIYLKKKGEPQ